MNAKWFREFGAHQRKLLSKSLLKKLGGYMAMGLLAREMRLSC